MIITFVYTLIIVVAGLLTNSTDVKSRKRYTIFCCLILFIISGFRGLHVGPDDTAIYVDSFYGMGNLSFESIFSGEFKDPVYYAFTKVLYGLIGQFDYTVFLCVFAAMFAISTGKLIYEESKNILLSYIILLSLGFFFFSMTGIRQTMAIVILLYSYRFLKERAFLRFVLCVLLASLFHKTAAVFLLIYPVAYWKLSFKSLALYLGVAAVFLLFGRTLVQFVLDANFDNRLEVYSLEGSKLTYSGAIQYILVFSLAACYYRRSLVNDPANQILYNMTIFAILFQIMAIYIAEFFRIAMYFGIFVVLLLPNVISTLPANRRRMVFWGASALFLIYFFYFGVARIPYNFCWE